MDAYFLDYLKKLKSHGIKNNIPNVTETVGRFLNMLIKIQSPKKILEIGSANGYSTLWMAEAAMQVGAIIHTIDHSKPTFDELEKNLLETSFNHIVKTHFGEAVKVIEQFDSSLTFDFVFVDGEKARYLDFWKVINKHLTEEAVVIFDDMIAFPEKTKTFENFLTKLEEWDQVLLPLDKEDGILLMRKL